VSPKAKNKLKYSLKVQDAEIFALDGIYPYSLKLLYYSADFINALLTIYIKFLLNL